MTRYSVDVIVPKKELEDAELYLTGKRFLEGIGPTIHCWTAKFENGIEVDIKVVNAKREDGGPWGEGVLFEDGCELACTEPSHDETVEGEWYFFVGDDEYIAFVVASENKGDLSPELD